MHAVTSFVRNLGDLIRARRRTGPGHEGNSSKMTMHTDEKSDEVVVAEEAAEQWERAPGGGCGGKDLAQGKRRPDGRGPDTEPERRVEWAGSRAPSGATE